MSIRPMHNMQADSARCGSYGPCSPMAMWCASASGDGVRANSGWDHAESGYLSEGRHRGAAGWMSIQDEWAGRFAAIAADQAAVYDSVLVPAVFGPCAERLAELAVRGPVSRVLDVGTGTGAVARAVAQRAGPRAAVVGVDLNPALLNAARRHGCRVLYCDGDVLDLPAGTAEFDVVLCQHVLQYVADLPAAVAEMARVARPGGWVWTVVWSRLEDNPGCAAIAELIRQRWGTAEATRFARPWAVSARMLRREMTQAGLVVCDEARVTFTTAFASIDDVLWLILFSPVGDLVRKLADGERAGFANRLRCVLAEWSEDGVVRMPVAAWAIGGRRV